MEGAVGNVSLRNKRFRLSPSRKWEGDRNRERGGGEWKKKQGLHSEKRRSLTKPASYRRGLAVLIVKPLSPNSDQH